MTTRRRPPVRRAFAMADLVAILIAFVALLIGILLPGLGKSREAARRVKDQAFLRGLGQSLSVFAANNRERYPLPGDLDRNGWTIANGDDPALKNTTRNIFSIMIWQSLLPTDMLVSAVETSPSFAVDEWYAYEHPPAAADPHQALWDPAFAATPEDRATPGGNAAPRNPGIGSMSWAHLPPLGERTKEWRDTFNASRAILSARGPTMLAVGAGADLAWMPADPTSTTLGRYDAPRGEWAGPVCFADTHVTHERTTAPPQLTLTFRTGASFFTRADNLFAAERTGDGPDAGASIDAGPDRFAQRDNWLRPIAVVRTTDRPGVHDADVFID